MKVTYNQLKAVVKAAVNLVESDGCKQEELVVVAKFLLGFNMDEGEVNKLYTEALMMDADEVERILDTIPEESRQEISNLWAEVIRNDGEVTDEEAVVFMQYTMMHDYPMPDTPEWVAWCSK